MARKYFPGRCYHAEDRIMIERELKLLIEDEVLKVLKPQGLSKWWDTKLPYKNRQTPKEIFNEGRGEELLTYVKDYSKEDFI